MFSDHLCITLRFVLTHRTKTQDTDGLLVRDYNQIQQIHNLFYKLFRYIICSNFKHLTML